MKMISYDAIDKFDDLLPRKEGSFAYCLQKQKESFKSLNEYTTINELRIVCRDFEILLERIIKRSKDYFGQIVDNIDIDKNKKHFDLSCIYISEIQNLYLNLINNEINKRQTEESLNKAKNSICWGKTSVWVGIASIVLAIVFATITFCQTKKSNENTRGYIEQQDSINNVRYKEYILYFKTL